MVGKNNKFDGGCGDCNSRGLCNRGEDCEFRDEYGGYGAGRVVDGVRAILDKMAGVLEVVRNIYIYIY